MSSSRGNGFDYPAQQTMVDARGLITPPWGQVFQRWQAVIQANYQSGTMAQRPTKLLWVGRQFYDTTLGKPVYVASVAPVVWKDAAGVVV